MSSSSNQRPTSQRRSSRFIEGQPLNYSPSSTIDPFFASILSEQDHLEARRAITRKGSDSTTSSSNSQLPKSTESLPQKQPIKSTRPPMEWKTAPAAPSSGKEKDRNSLQEGQLKEKTSRKIVGRIRAFTAGYGGLERKFQKKGVAPYPGT